MSNKNLIPTLFTISFLVIIIGTLLKILHQPYGELFLIIALVLTVIYSALSLKEIFSCKSIDTTEKIMWLVGFMFINTITGLVYILSARKRINRNLKLNI